VGSFTPFGAPALEIGDDFIFGDALAQQHFL
jgi:hypothetical protein